MTVTELQKDEVKNLIRRGRKLEAVKYLKENFGLSLKQAKHLADEISFEIQDDVIRDFTGNRINSASINKKMPNVGKIVGGIFAFVGIIFLTVSGIVFYNNDNFIKEAVKVQGVVADYPNKPLFEYEFEGQVFYFQSTTTSNPPSYYLGEEVEIFIDPLNPQNSLINTFSERWALITIFGGMGILFFSLGSAAFFLMRQR